MPRKAKRLTATNSAGYAAPAAIAADPVIFTVAPSVLLAEGRVEEGGKDVLAVLLVRRDEDPFKGLLQLPGGFVGEMESAEETAARKLSEKTGVHAGYLEQLRTYDDHDRDPRGWIPSIAYLALLPHHRLSGVAASSHQAEWMAVDHLADGEIGFDHRKIIDDALERLRGKLWYSNIAMGLLPEEFTTGEARRIYEAIVGQEFDEANFARDIKASGLLVETGKTKPTRTKPGKAYRFRSRKPEWSTRRERGGRAR